MKNERKEETNTEVSRLRKGFKALSVNHQKGVLKTAQGLLRIQKAHKTMTADNTCYIDFSFKKRIKNEAKT